VEREADLYAELFEKTAEHLRRVLTPEEPPKTAAQLPPWMLAALIGGPVSAGLAGYFLGKKSVPESHPAMNFGAGLAAGQALQPVWSALESQGVNL